MLRNTIFWWLFWVLLILAAVPAGAQTRSDTGRHRAKQVKPPQEEAEDSANKVTTPADLGWSFSGSVGLLGAGRAFQVETVSGASVPWDMGNGPSFQASRFNATFDQNMSFGLQVRKGMGHYWGLDSSLGYSRMNLGAEALVGQQGTVVLLDRVDVFTFGLGGRLKMVKAPSHPFISGAAVLTSLGAAVIQEMDQTHVGWRVGLGYRQVVSKQWAANIEMRLSRIGFSLGDYTPTSPQLEPSGIIFEAENNLTFFEIMLSLEFH